jgi:hypothetical protein
MTLTFAIVTSEARAAAALASLKVDAIKGVGHVIEALTRDITGLVPTAEMLSWPLKEGAARAALARTASEVEIEMLAIEASVTDEAVDALALDIIEKAIEYRRFAATIAGIRRNARRDILGAVDDDAVARAQGAALEAIRALRDRLKD